MALIEGIKTITCPAIDYFHNLSNAEIETAIAELNPIQRRVFEEEIQGKTRRHALFIAKSF